MYSDSDWGSDKDTRRSTSGVLIIMAGGPVTTTRSSNNFTIIYDYLLPIFSCMEACTYLKKEFNDLLYKYCYYYYSQIFPGFRAQHFYFATLLAGSALQLG